MPPPLRPEKGGGLVNVKVRRITEVKPISTTAPPPSTALQGKHRLLVVLVETTDSPWPKAYTRGRYQELIFSRSAESMSEYWRENSYGAYQLTGEVVGPLKVPGRMTDYSYDRNQADGRRVKQLIQRAVEAAAKKVDLKSFDTHDARGKKQSDGMIDHLMVVYAEKSGKHDGFSPIWPHRGSLDLEVAGIRVGSYTVLNHAARLGVYVHEFGHDLGLPDLYDRDYSSHGAGDWCTMASGSWLGSAGIPAHVSAWAKIRLGWIAPKVISKSDPALEIPSSSEKPFALKIPIGEVDSPEYFIVENRTRVGFDRELAAEGVLIWHVDDLKGDNDDEQRKMVDVVEATEIQDLDRIDNFRMPKYSPDVFTADTNARFADDTNPSARSYSNQPSQIAIDILTPAQRVMKLAVRRPTIFDPGGIPYVLSRDGYNHGRFATVPLGAGSEALMPLDATPGGYLAFAADVFASGRPHHRDDLIVRVYGDAGGKPGKVLEKTSARVEIPREGYTWVRARLAGERGLRLKAHQRVWLGVTSRRGKVYAASNPFSVSKEARYRRKQTSRKIQGTFNFKTGKQPAADYVIRLSGFGYLEGNERPDPMATDADPLILRMKEIDELADAGKHEEVLPAYEALLAEMEKDGRRYGTWIPVVVNSIGVTAYELKKYDVALARFETTLRRALAAKDRTNTADVYENIGETAFAAGDFARAAESCQRSYELNAELGRRDRLVENLYWLGRAHQEQKAADAEGFFERALVAAKEAFPKDLEQEQRWIARIEKAMNGAPEDEPNVKKRAKAMEEEGKGKHRAVYTDLLQFLSDDTAGE